MGQNGKQLYQVERSADHATISIAMVTIFAPLPAWLGRQLMPSFLFRSFWWDDLNTFFPRLLSLLFRLLRGAGPPPPRAVFRVSADHLFFEETNPFTGEVQQHDWRVSQIAQLRESKFGPGMWIEVRGSTKKAYLEEIHSTTIEAVAEEVWKLIAEFKAKEE